MNRSHEQHQNSTVLQNCHKNDLLFSSMVGRTPYISFVVLHHLSNVAGCRVWIANGVTTMVGWWKVQLSSEKRKFAGLGWLSAISLASGLTPCFYGLSAVWELVFLNELKNFGHDVAAPHPTSVEVVEPRCKWDLFWAATTFGYRNGFSQRSLGLHCIATGKCFTGVFWVSNSWKKDMSLSLGRRWPVKELFRVTDQCHTGLFGERSCKMYAIYRLVGMMQHVKTYTHMHAKLQLYKFSVFDMSLPSYFGNRSINHYFVIIQETYAVPITS